MCFFNRRGFGLRLAPQFPRIPTSCRWHLVQSFWSFRVRKRAYFPGSTQNLCGETGIRTPETLLEFTRFPGVPLQPLEHLSFALSGAKLNIGYKITTFFAHTQEFVQIFTYFLLFYAEKLSCISTCSLNYLIHGHI